METVEAIYHWHSFYIDALATRMRASVTHFFLHDANHNVTAAVRDSDNSVVERYKYSPYGDVTILDDNFADDSDQISDIGNQHLYTGRERDPETGLQLNRHRYYASHLGRWTSRDPIAQFTGTGGSFASRPAITVRASFSQQIDEVDAGYNEDGYNLYQYVLGNPPILLDPSGLAWWNPWDWFQPPPPPKPPITVPIRPKPPRAPSKAHQAQNLCNKAKRKFPDKNLMCKFIECAEGKASSPLKIIFLDPGSIMWASGSVDR